MILYILDLKRFEKSDYCQELPKPQKQHVAGQYLLRQAVGDEAYEQAEFAKNEHGKPYIIGNPIYYNISHSGQYVVLVTAETEVGADIQEKRAARMDSIAKRFFSEGEWQAFSVCDDEDEKKKLFYHIWCRKEAYGKYLGTGLSNHSLGTNVLEESVVWQGGIPDKNAEGSAELKACKFHDLEMIENYQISICSRKGEHLEKIVSVFEGL